MLTMEETQILIADDQADVLEALQILLKNEGFATEVVTSPRAVVEAVEKKAYDILLLDLNYARDTTSGGEGLELLSKLQTIDSSLPVVLMTAWGSIDLAVQTMQGGGRDFIQKPWDNERLLGTLRRHVEEGRALREKRRQEKAAEWLIREIEEAREIQQRLLPSEMPRVKGCEIQASWQPANDVGGDYFDAIHLSDTSAAFCIADVSGKGLPAALLMSNTQATVRAFAHRTSSPGEICGQLNRIVAENMSSGKFITMFYGVLDTARHKLRYTNAGHIPPVLIRKDGTLERLTEGGIVLGVFSDASYDEVEVPFAPGDRLLLFTDGITEANNAGSEEFGMDRLTELLIAHRNKPASQMLGAILHSVAQFTAQGFQDDATVLIITME
jgi:sigma-B regulation protein RsbU (phosphoserine phosphatase)